MHQQSSLLQHQGNNTHLQGRHTHKDMKLAIICTLAMSAIVLGAQLPQKAVIVSYPNETPDHILDQAKDAIKAAGGMITHEYKLIK